MPVHNNFASLVLVTHTAETEPMCSQRLVWFERLLNDPISCGTAFTTFTTVSNQAVAPGLTAQPWNAE